MEHEQPDWLAYAEPEWGFGRVTVSGGDALLFEYVRSDDGAVRDSVRLRNSRARARACQRGSPGLDPAARGAMGSERTGPPKATAMTGAKGGEGVVSQGAAEAAAPGPSRGPAPLWLVGGAGSSQGGGSEGAAQAGAPGVHMPLGPSRASGEQPNVTRAPPVTSVDVA